MSKTGDDAFGPGNPLVEAVAKAIWENDPLRFHSIRYSWDELPAWDEVREATKEGVRRQARAAIRAVLGD